MQNSKVLFIGLGRMGFHMSSHLSKNKKIDLFINNRTEVISKKWLKSYSGINYHFNSDIKFDYVITCLKDDRALDIVVKKLLKVGCFKKNTLFIDHSTISLDQVKKINILASLNKFYFLDAPVTGGVEGAKNRSLSLMVGGSLSKLKKSESILL